MEIVTIWEIVHCANVLGKKKVQCPVKCHTDLLIQAGQFGEIKLSATSTMRRSPRN